MKKDLKRAGIEYENKNRRIDFHALRHTLATNLACRGVTPRIAMEILRHSDIRVTMNHNTMPHSYLWLRQPKNFLPLGSANTGQGNTQIHTQTPDISSNRQSPRGTPPAETELSGGVLARPGTTRHSRAI